LSGVPSIFISSASSKLRLRDCAKRLLNDLPAKDKLFIPSIFPCRTKAISVVPPPISIKIAPEIGLNPDDFVKAYDSAVIESNSKSSFEAMLSKARK